MAGPEASGNTNFQIRFLQFKSNVLKFLDKSWPLTLIISIVGIFVFLFFGVKVLFTSIVASGLLSLVFHKVLKLNKKAQVSTLNSSRRCSSVNRNPARLDEGLSDHPFDLNQKNERNIWKGPNSMISPSGIKSRNVQMAAGPLLKHSQPRKHLMYADSKEPNYGYLSHTTRTLLSASRHYPHSQANYNSLGSMPTVYLNNPLTTIKDFSGKNHVLHSPVTVKIAPPRQLTPSQCTNLSLSFTQTKSTEKLKSPQNPSLNPCSPETVVAALRDSRKRRRKDPSDSLLKDKETKRKRQVDDESNDSGSDSVHIKMPKTSQHKGINFANTPDLGKGLYKRPATPSSHSDSPGLQQMIKRHKNDAITSSHSSTKRASIQMDTLLPSIKKQKPNSIANSSLAFNPKTKSPSFFAPDVIKTVQSPAEQEPKQDKVELKESEENSSKVIQVEVPKPLEEWESNKRGLDVFKDLKTTNQNTYLTPHYIPTLSDYEEEEKLIEKRLEHLLGAKRAVSEASKLETLPVTLDIAKSFTPVSVEGPKPILFPTITPLATTKSDSTLTMTSGEMIKPIASQPVSFAPSIPTTSSTDSPGSNLTSELQTTLRTSSAPKVFETLKNPDATLQPFTAGIGAPSISRISASTNTGISTPGISGFNTLISPGNSTSGNAGISNPGNAGISNPGNAGISNPGNAGISSSSNTGINSLSNTGISSLSNTGISSLSNTGISSLSNTGIPISILSPAITGINNPSITGISTPSITGISTPSVTGIITPSITGISTPNVISSMTRLPSVTSAFGFTSSPIISTKTSVTPSSLKAPFLSLTSKSTSKPSDITGSCLSFPTSSSFAFPTDKTVQNATKTSINNFFLPQTSTSASLIGSNMFSATSSLTDKTPFSIPTTDSTTPSSNFFSAATTSVASNLPSFAPPSYHTSHAIVAATQQENTQAISKSNLFAFGASAATSQSSVFSNGFNMTQANSMEVPNPFNQSASTATPFGANKMTFGAPQQTQTFQPVNGATNPLQAQTSAPFSFGLKPLQSNFSNQLAAPNPFLAASSSLASPMTSTPTTFAPSVGTKNFNFGAQENVSPFGAMQPTTNAPYVFSGSVPATPVASNPNSQLFSIGSGVKDRRIASNRRRLAKR